jgi:cytochrome b6-f complex iron-sulfur subunit
MDPESEREPITETQYDVTRRRFFNRAIYAAFGLFVAQFALASLAFMWPKLKGGFGVVINVGSFNDLKSDVIQGGTIVPKFFPEAQAWVVPMELSLIPESSYRELPHIVTGGQDDGIGLMALWMRCPHLGCRVPECIPSLGFECPCHGSKFNIHGEYAQGPAPRNMDRFAVSTNEAGDLIIDTGTIVQTARSKKYTADYPAGPFCV